MIPFYWESQVGNFGDDLNLWLWDFLLPGFRDVRPDVLLVGVGTVLNENLLPKGIRKLVVGSGFGYGALPDVTDVGEWDLRAVRGPLTAAKLGLERSLAIVDPAVMVSEMPEFRNLPKINRTVFVPHWASATGGVWTDVCSAAGLGYVDPRKEAKSVIRAIAQSECVLAESMHAAIIADAFRVPWIAVSTSPEINGFKWRDWAGSLGMIYEPRHVPVSTRAEARAKGARFWGVGFNRRLNPAMAGGGEGHAIVTPEPQSSPLRALAKHVLATPSVLALRRAGRAKPQLSRDDVLRERKERFAEVLDGVRRDYF